jgi:hypothetical protein
MLKASLDSIVDRIVEDLDVYNAQCQMHKASMDRIVEDLDAYNAQCQMLKASLDRRLLKTLMSTSEGYNS